MKTPEQIAREAAETATLSDSVNEHGAHEPVIEDLGQLASFIEDGIRVDRAQRADLLEREARILDSYRQGLPESATFALKHNMSRVSEAMRLAARWDATRAFQESHR